MRNIILALCLSFAAIADATAQDWPNLKKYKTENSKLPQPGENENRVVYMGDSITDFWLGSDSVFFVKNNYIDRGISGQTTGQMLLRFRQDVIALKPKIVVILAGINDIAGNNGPESVEEIFGNIVSMAQLANANNIKVIISSILPAFKLPWRPEVNPVPEVNELNALLKDYAAKNGAFYLDYFSAMADEKGGMRAELSKDGVHPAKAGYKVMEPLAESAIRAALRPN